MFNKVFFKTIFYIVLANLFLVIGINIFLIPSEIFPTGFTGLSNEISFALDKFLGIQIPYNIVYFLLNIPIIIFGYFKVGNKFILKTIVSILLFTFFANIIPQINLIDIQTSGDRLISTVLSGIIMGFGIGLLLKVGSSSGGLDIVAVYISLFKGKSFGLYNLIMNSFVILIAFLLLGDLKSATFSLINLYVINAVIDKIHNSQEKRIMLIFTSHQEKVTSSMYQNIFRGITILDSIGGYTKSQNSTLLISINQGEIQRAVNIIKTSDPDAFINIIKADQIIGNFENPYKKML